MWTCQLVFRLLIVLSLTWCRHIIVLCQHSIQKELWWSFFLPFTHVNSLFNICYINLIPYKFRCWLRYILLLHCFGPVYSTLRFVMSCIWIHHHWAMNRRSLFMRLLVVEWLWFQIVLTLLDTQDVVHHKVGWLVSIDVCSIRACHHFIVLAVNVVQTLLLLLI